MKASTILTAAQARISSPEKWTQGNYARDVDGDPCPASDNRAVCWCSVGALLAEESLNVDQFSMAHEFLGRAAQRTFGLDTVEINDTRGHADVMRMFDAARELAQAEDR